MASADERRDPLIAVARSCAEEVDLKRLALIVGDALLQRSAIGTAGVAVFDEERQVVQRFSATLMARTEDSSGDGRVFVS